MPNYNMEAASNKGRDASLENIRDAASTFWDIGNYKRTVKRVDDGVKLCDDMLAMIRDRMELERAYARSLKRWASDWRSSIQNGPEYGTMEESWKACFTEADEVANLHADVREKLLSKAYDSVKKWKKDHYHKSMMHYKETRDCDDNFSRIQKPWAKRFEKVVKAKKEYYSAAKAEDNNNKQLNTAESDNNMAADQVKKIRDKADKASKEASRAKDRYKERLEDLTTFNDSYQKSMTEEFDRWQAFEEDRLIFFKEMLVVIHNCVNIADNPNFSKIYNEMLQTIEKADSGRDLCGFAEQFGARMETRWPEFEEYTVTEKAAVKKSSSKFKKIQDSSENVSAPENTAKVEKINPSNEDHDTNDGYNRQISFDNEWDEPPSFNDGEGVPVRALYEYTRRESDELSFAAGDIIMKLSEEDGQGWIKGSLNGTVGLVPANYVEAV
ncbi:Protein kinase C and casein kinase substrate in neurons protein 1 [Trichoplax sp. H2]|nr:Protein kinase C and casein kinase substrate in neurons protein 1 [Trichoplax sp. H2]|eukprot:RDD38909.1 Protein kinase C and casein kinase substrate in neurons protein 1 [Trichoplax sp. H2]